MHADEHLIIPHTHGIQPDLHWVAAHVLWAAQQQLKTDLMLHNGTSLYQPPLPLSWVTCHEPSTYRWFHNRSRHWVEAGQVDPAGVRLWGASSKGQPGVTT